MNSIRVLLITGTRKGIGKYLAEYYTSKGFHVIGCSRNPIDFELTNYQHFCLDVSDESKVKQMFSEIRKTFGRLDVLINNAAINLSISPAMLIPVSAVLESLQVNFIGTFLMSRESVKLMKKQSFGRIINFGSMAVRHEVPGESIYTASKAAVITFSRVFAKEIYNFGITCNVIAPSAIKTDLSGAVNAEALSDVLQRNASHTFAQMEDISNMTDWILRPESHMITGQVIYLGGV
jgi:3-oxoacyl-[acyl-carrier protein] reductase